MLLNILILAAAIGVAVKWSLIQIGAPSWSYYPVVVVLAVVLHLINVILIRRYISRRAPAFASTDEVSPGVQAWELTAGTGVVPEWVSLIGLAAMGSLLALLMPTVSAILR